MGRHDPRHVHAGVVATPEETARAHTGPARVRHGLGPGLVAAGALAAVALALARLVPLAGAPVLALALGIALASARAPAPALRPGLAFAARTVLQVGIVLLGATLSLGQVLSVGAATLPVMLGTLAAALAVAALAGRRLGVGDPVRTLIGVGTGICGASAIAAVSGIIGAAEAEIAYAISTIFVFNLVAVLLFPLLGHALGLSQHAFGVWAGTAVNDTSSVAAAGYAYGKAAGTHAVLVKLTRTTAIVPIAAALALRHRRGVRWIDIVPWFVLWFVAAAGLRSAGVVSTAAHDVLQQASTTAITLALAAVGLSTRVGDLRRAGARPLLLGTLVWASVAVTGLALQTV